MFIPHLPRISRRSAAGMNGCRVILPAGSHTLQEGAGFAEMGKQLLNRFGKRRPRSWCRRSFRLASFSAVLACAALLVVPSMASAQVAANVTGLTETTGLRQVDIRVLIVRIVQFALGFLGLLAVLVTMYGGYLWMTAAGSEEQVTQAKRVLTNGLIGLAIILTAFTIVSYIFSFFKLRSVPGGGGQPPGPCTNCTALGGGIIESHYPPRDATDIPRNTKISITFKEPILVSGDPSTSIVLNPVVVSGNVSGDVNTNVFQLTPPDDPTTVPDESKVPISDMKVYTNAQHKIFVFKPKTYLGSATENTAYLATVKGRSGSTGLTKSDGSAGMFGDYQWKFQVSTVIDTTPPNIIDIFPYDGVTEARNATVQITFDEAIDPLTAAGDASGGFRNITLDCPSCPPLDLVVSTTVVAGSYDIGNGYRTVEFHPKNQCGVNACGQPIFCLSANEHFAATSRAATLANDATHCSTAGEADTSNPSVSCPPPPSDGVTDMADNSLDGQRNPTDTTKPLVLPTGNGTADGPYATPTDTFTWRFATNSRIVKTGPKVLPNVCKSNGTTACTSDADCTAPSDVCVKNVLPAGAEANIKPKDPVVATFNRRLRLVRSSDVRVYAQGTVGPFSPYWTGLNISATTCGADATGQASCPDHNSASCTQPADPEDINMCGRSVVVINHDAFAPSGNYEPRLASTINDIYGNCFSPSSGPFVCEGGANPGQFCAVDADCGGGGSCVPTTSHNLGSVEQPVDAPNNFSP